MRLTVLMIALLALVGCGVDEGGDTPQATGAGGGSKITLSGCASFGVAKGAAGQSRAHGC